MSRITFFVLLCLVFTLPWEGYWSSEEALETTSRILGAVAFMAGVVGVLMGCPPRRPSLVFIPIGMFIAWCFASMSWSLDGSKSLEEGVTFVLLAILVWLMFQYAGSPSRHRWIVHAVIVGTVTMMCSLYLNFFGGVGPEIGVSERYEATQSNANGVAFFLVLAANFAYYLVAGGGEKTNRALKIAYWGFIVAAGFGVLLTGSRTGIIGLILSVAVLMLTSARSGWKPALMFTICVASVIYLIFHYLPDEVMSRFQEGTGAHTLQTRMEFWKIAYDAWLNKPLEGYGAGTSSLITGHAVIHNTVLGLLLELGVIGLGLFLAIFGGLLLRVFSLPRAEKMLWISVLANMVPHLAAGSMEYQKSIWLIFAMIVAQPSSVPETLLPGKPDAKETAGRRA